MAKPSKFVFVCINERDPEHPRPSCFPLGGADIFNALREEQGRRRNDDVKVVAALCLEACRVGPVVGVYPDDVYYGGVTEDDVPAIMDHLEGDEPVRFLKIGDADFRYKG
ncbi:(2Fe-2S) ferredoxin domain-containing protein [Euzebya tangerina]|uniref:(2Fe-2S) ferredoxin domain-containing protein n=1 Tax=Euzebya tangerina TaxID=591198 RepID=UPI0013C344AB|nr:(2Fe-2S) ferredoxin domain-containing protein [Euzebya tangerina]